MNSHDTRLDRLAGKFFSYMNRRANHTASAGYFPFFSVALGIAGSETVRLHSVWPFTLVAFFGTVLGVVAIGAVSEESR